MLPTCDKTVKIPVKVNSAYPEPQPICSTFVDPAVYRLKGIVSGTSANAGWQSTLKSTILVLWLLKLTLLIEVLYRFPMYTGVVYDQLWICCIFGFWFSKNEKEVGCICSANLDT